VVSNKLVRVFPFLDWFRTYSTDFLRRDLVSGLTVALVLVPQSMAYAQLGGLPAHYGLYAAFLPPLVASLFGSSRQLATGPVAIVSLMTATALEPLATAGSEAFIAYAILLALLIGVFQLLLGVFRLGLVVNFLSHPVVNGFTNAAALIIATSQLSKLFGVTVDGAEHHYQTVTNVVMAAWSFTHWPTLALAILAFVIMIIMRKLVPRFPSVLAAVLVTTVIAWAIDFERNDKARLEQIEVARIQVLVQRFNTTVTMLTGRCEERVEVRKKQELMTRRLGEQSAQAIGLKYDLALLNNTIDSLRESSASHRHQLRQFVLTRVRAPDGTAQYLEPDQVPADAVIEGSHWRLKVGNVPLKDTALAMTGGGEVVGHVPSGLPGFRIPVFELSTALSLFPVAMIISLLGFMEAISIAKAMAARTGQRLDPNQELIGQGLANLIGSFGQSYAVSGSFSRSAVNLQAGAATGMASVFSSLVVLIVLLLFTPLLYHLPQSVLAAIIMMAVVGLVNVKTFVHTWRAQRVDGIIGVVSFVCTLALAPHLDRGIMIGVALSLLLYLLRNMKPAIAMLSLHPDGTYRNRARFDLEQCRHIAVIRYAGSIFFANVSYLEDQVLDTVRLMPQLRHLLIVGNGINELDASGEETLGTLVTRLHERGLKVSFSGLNDVVIDVMRRTGLLARIGEQNLYRNAMRAIESIWEGAHVNSDEDPCPLKVVPLKRWKVADKYKTGSDMNWPPKE
jgi:MFS superfamily sulfate permease-like transporter